ncbi:carboxymuconolactone decarboxylase family protein [Streptomyces sp. NBC_01022]|uniref:carboxymuconolactone decarboxylase family protein n=1 Tax=Streptomyces sp. NBC_01022 TaxID=2903723 RepID=UPI002DDAD463|nr:carboxymuconolactone decarboxylase family protein [Streptomyces sp. NBC_01022]WRZ80210.1 carboxymuconolactone decarboxylase family protein [Streptomyces sp. NBC_01022]
MTEASDAVTPFLDRMRERGEWNPLWDGLAELDPHWTEDYLRTATQPWRSGVLPPKVIELLCIAVDAACTHMYAPGVRRHIRAALDLGVTAEEILEVLKLVTVIGIHSCNIGAPILMEELDAREKGAASP